MQIYPRKSSTRRTAAIPGSPPEPTNSLLSNDKKSARFPTDALPVNETLNNPHNSHIHVNQMSISSILHHATCIDQLTSIMVSSNRISFFYKDLMTFPNEVSIKAISSSFATGIARVSALIGSSATSAGLSSASFSGSSDAGSTS